MIGIVVVSHSAMLAEGVCELAAQARLEHAPTTIANRARGTQLGDGAGDDHSSSPRPLTRANISGGGIEPSV